MYVFANQGVVHEQARELQIRLSSLDLLVLCAAIPIECHQRIDALVSHVLSQLGADGSPQLELFMAGPSVDDSLQSPPHAATHGLSPGQHPLPSPGQHPLLSPGQHAPHSTGQEGEVLAPTSEQKPQVTWLRCAVPFTAAQQQQQLFQQAPSDLMENQVVSSGSLEAHVWGTLVKPRHFGLLDSPTADLQDWLLCVTCIHHKYLLLGMQSGIHSIPLLLFHALTNPESLIIFSL